VLRGPFCSTYVASRSRAARPCSFSTLSQRTTCSISPTAESAALAPVAAAPSDLGMVLAVSAATIGAASSHSCTSSARSGPAAACAAAAKSAAVGAGIAAASIGVAAASIAAAAAAADARCADRWKTMGRGR